MDEKNINPLMVPKEFISNDVVYNKIEPHEIEKRKVVRDGIQALEDAMFSGIDDGQLSEAETPLKHYFLKGVGYTHGVYAREMFLPKGTVLIGKLHKLPRLCIMSQGECSFVTEYGAKRVKAPYTTILMPGSKVAAYAHEDTVWTAIHGTDDTDLEILEANLIAKDRVEYEEFVKALGCDPEYARVEASLEHKPIKEE